MGAAFRVSGAVAVLRTDKGNERYVYRGGVIESTPDTEASIKHLLSVGLIEESQEVPASDDNPEELPADAWNHERIDAWAAAQTPSVELVNPDPSKQFTKAQKLEQINAELTKRSVQ